MRMSKIPPARRADLSLPLEQVGRPRRLSVMVRVALSVFAASAMFIGLVYIRICSYGDLTVLGILPFCTG